MTAKTKIVEAKDLHPPQPGRAAAGGCGVCPHGMHAVAPVTTVVVSTLGAANDLTVRYTASASYALTVLPS